MSIKLTIFNVIKSCVKPLFRLVHEQPISGRDEKHFAADMRWTRGTPYTADRPVVQLSHDCVPGKQLLSAMLLAGDTLGEA